VLKAWREEDAREPEEPAREPDPERAPLAGPHALEPELVDGLSEAVCERLHAEGVHTLELLVASELGALALRSGLGYSRLYRWRILAERRLRAAAAPAAAPEEARLSPAELPVPSAPRDLLAIPARGLDLPRRTLRWSPLEEGAAGPFA
jgi:hypothetical protein